MIFIIQFEFTNLGNKSKLQFGNSVSKTVLTVFWIAVNFVQHTHPSNAAAVIKRLKNLIRTGPSDCMNLTIKKPKVTAGSRPPDRRTIFKDREDEGVVTAKQHRGVSMHSIYHPQHTHSLRDS